MRWTHGHWQSVAKQCIADSLAAASGGAGQVLTSHECAVDLTYTSVTTLSKHCALETWSAVSSSDDRSNWPFACWQPLPSCIASYKSVPQCPNSFGSCCVITSIFWDNMPQVRRTTDGYKLHVRYKCYLTWFICVAGYQKLLWRWRKTPLEASWQRQRLLCHDFTWHGLLCLHV